MLSVMQKVLPAEILHDGVSNDSLKHFAGHSNEAYVVIASGLH